MSGHAYAASGSPIRTVEFVGVCGSGKSTLARLVVAEASRQLPGDLSVARLPPRGFLDCLRSAPTATASLVMLSPSVAWALLPTGAERSLVLARLRQDVAARVDTRPLTVFQEGTAAAVWRALVRHPTAVKRSLMRALLPAADLTVILDVPPAVAHRRITDKPDPGPMNRLLASSPLDGPLWGRAMDAHKAVADTLREVGGGATITLDNSETPATEEVVRLLLPNS